MNKLAQQFSRKRDELGSLLSPDRLNELAQQTRFIKRSSNRLPVLEMVQLLSIEMLKTPKASLETMSHLLYESSGIEIGASALCQRLNTQECEDWFFEILKEVLTLKTQGALRKIESNLLSPFNRVLLGDSTQCKLHPSLSLFFNGSMDGSSVSEGTQSFKIY